MVDIVYDLYFSSWQKRKILKVSGREGGREPKQAKNY